MYRGQLKFSYFDQAPHYLHVRKVAIVPIELLPFPINTAGTVTPVTNSNRISWADMVRRNPRHKHSVQEPIRDRFFDTIGKYATRLNKL